MASPLGSAPGIMVGVGVGSAAAAALEPLVEPGRQNAWNDHPNKVLDPGIVARLVAQGAVELGDGQKQARREGFDTDKFNQLVYLAQTVPGFSEALEMWRRFDGFDDLWTHSLTKKGLDARYLPFYNKLKTTILSPGELAASIHRGLVPDPGILLGEQPSGPRKVASYPVQPIDAVAEALGSGFDKERLSVLVGLQGLPMGVIEAAQSVYRDIITHGDYIAAFNESNNRNEWAEAVLEYARQIPTARDFFENALRGYHDLAWAQEQAQRHGMTPDDSLVIYQNQGRPMNIHAITQALARGAKFNPEPGEIKDPYHAAIVEGNLKPGYYEMAESLKYTLPSVFTMRSLAESKVWSEEKTAERLKWAGWLPEDADEAAKAWASGGGSTADPHVAKAQTQLWTTTHASYKAREIGAGTATTALEKAGVTAGAVPTVLDIWNAERDLIRARLQASDVRKAYQKQDANPRTNAAWTRADAVAELLELGWSNEDAEAYLNIG
jgi:hypothetical protein